MSAKTQSSCVVKSELCLHKTSNEVATFMAIKMTPQLDGVWVSTQKELRDITNPDKHVRQDVEPDLDQFVHWEQMPDVECLACLFFAQRVDVFQRIVKLLGDLYRMQTGVKLLMQKETESIWTGARTR